jgi:hypothetical protein
MRRLTKMIIKNPLNIIVKKEELSGFPIEIDSLDDSLLTANNEGKIYVCDGKLYRVVGEETLKGTTVTFTGPHTFTAPTGYGKFKIEGSYENTLIQKGTENGVIIAENTDVKTYDFYNDENPNLYIGYEKTSEYNEKENEIHAITNKNGSSYDIKIRNKIDYVNETFENQSVYLFETVKLFITGGEDANNPKLIQWVKDNNGAIEGEGREYHFEELKATSPQLVDLTRATVTVDTYLFTEGLGEFTIYGTVEGNEYDESAVYTLEQKSTQYYNLFLGYDKTDSLYPKDEYMVVCYRSDSNNAYEEKYVKGKNVKITITGGRDATNSNLIKILLEHNAVIEGGVYE